MIDGDRWRADGGGGRRADNPSPLANRRFFLEKWHEYFG